MKQYLGLIRDHSMSMTSLRMPAMDDYNKLIETFKSAAYNSGIETYATVLKCGIASSAAGYSHSGYFNEGMIEREQVNVNIHHLTPITVYPATGGSTPLFDSVGEMIDIFKGFYDYNMPSVSFLIMAVTDGEDNRSPKWKHRIADEIKNLQLTDKWSFVFRVPRGYARYLSGLGVPLGNIHEWELTEKGMRRSTICTESAVHNYYETTKTRGVHSNSTFYSNLKTDVAGVRKALCPISKEASIYPNNLHEGATIKEVSVHYTGEYKRGTVFYQLTKREPRVQDYKLICLREKNKPNIYGGTDARDLLGIPHTGTIALAPGDHKDYEIYIQSTAYNRKIPMGGNVLLWNNARVMKKKR